MIFSSVCRRIYRIKAVLCSTLLLALPAMGQTLFTDVTDDLAVVPDSRSIGFGDYDNDGLLDAFLGENSGQSRIALLHNEADGRFSNQISAIQALVPSGAKGGGSLFVDYDNDGDLDLFIAIGSSFQRRVNRLLRNDRGRFVDITLAAGLLDSLPTENALWFDYDRDGDLDLYLGNWADQSLHFAEGDPPIFNLLYRNEGDGTFSDQTEAAGLLIPFSGMHGGSQGGMVAGDFNDDGWPDLYLGITNVANRLFLNDGQGHFADVTAGDIGDEGEAFSVAVGDINNDGRLDIFQGAGGSFAEGFRSLMLLNRGVGEFLDVTEGAGLGLDVLGANTLGTGFADIDNDGDLDLLIGFTLQEFLAGNVLLLNDGTGAFTDATALSGIDENGGYIAFGDYNEDGFVDLLFASFTRRITALYRNNGNANHWLRVELVGRQSNRHGIGARVIATSDELEQMREILGGMGRQQDEYIAHFGLRERTQVDRLEIRWPSGQVDVLRDIPVDQKIRVFEGREEYHRVQPTAWVSRVDSVVAGASFAATVAVRPERFDSGAEIGAVTAELSSFGGSVAAALDRRADGTFALQTSLQAPEQNGFYPLSVMIDQQTLLGSYWTRLSRRVAVLPAGDAVIFAEDLATGWTLTAGEVTQVAFFADRTAAWLPNETSLNYRTEEPLSAVGYTALRFAFHPGEATAAATNFLRVRINARATLLPAPADGPGLTLDPVWQEVEVPLKMLGVRPEDSIDEIRFLLNMQGSVRLADIRLVAAQPPPPATAVLERRIDAQPTSFELAQNYPNPFNGLTVIRFVLPTAQEIELALYNLAGQQVATLARGWRRAGAYALDWDGRDDMGRALASGVYLYRLEAGAGQAETRKLVLLR